MHKYPRTHHIEGSRLQPGDEDLEAVPYTELRGAHLVVEEKIDGANSAVSFDTAGRLQLQSRGHFLAGGPRERQFARLKSWANRHRDALYAALGDRYVMYGEWAFAKHTIFYDALPHYFLEFDVLDTRDGAFLSTPRRAALLAECPIVSVPVLHAGVAPPYADLLGLITRSLYKTDGWRDRLAETAAARGLDVARARAETDPSDDAEGLYMKEETADHVTARYKYVRASFLDAVQSSGSHWFSRPILPNQLADGVDLFDDSPARPPT